MSFVLASPEVLVVAAADLSVLGSTISQASAAAASATTGLASAAQDEVSAAIAALFSAHGREYQVWAAGAAAFHDEFTQTLTTSAGWYAAAEASAQQSLLDVINAPSEALLGRPLIGNGANGGQWCGGSAWW
ncbi:PE family protein [Mycobacterium riyadhense]|uniref:PE family protein n=1 Tax=Mycobacterium riyadhense TaxID=486698 RepID=UPI003B969D9E